MKSHIGKLGCHNINARWPFRVLAGGVGVYASVIVLKNAAEAIQNGQHDRLVLSVASIVAIGLVLRIAFCGAIEQKGQMKANIK